MKDKHQYLLATESIGKLLWKFSLPSTIGMLVANLYNIIDTIFIGHAVGGLGIAGLSIVFPFQMIVVGIAQTIAVGSASLISIALGAKEHAKAELYLGNALCLAIVFGLLITVTILPFSSFFLRVIGSSRTILPYAKAYIDIILLGTAVVTSGMVITSIIRAEGRVLIPMIITLVAAILNIILDAVFIFGFNMGIRGAAVATIISQAVFTGFLFYYLLSGRSTLRVHLRNFILNLSIAWEIFAIGIASFMRTSSNSVATIILNHLLGFYGGDTAIAVFGILNRIIMFLFMPQLGIAQGIQPIIGFNYGAKLYARVKKATKLAITIVSSISVLSALIIFLFPVVFIRVFTTEQALISEGSHAIMFLAPALAMVGFQIIAAIMFQSLGKAKPSFFLSILRNFIFFLPLIFILPLFLKLDGLWLSFPVAYALALIVTIVMFRQEMRKLATPLG
jgi:putative MATE family efflux protein